MSFSFYLKIERIYKKDCCRIVRVFTIDNHFSTLKSEVIIVRENEYIICKEVFL